jgi:hypothetical protein
VLGGMGSAPELPSLGEPSPFPTRDESDE